MIKIFDIKVAIVSLLEQLNIEVYGNEIKEGFDRPCFFVQIMPISNDTVTKNFSENKITVEIMYFSENETDIENVQMHDSLSSIFSKSIGINDRKILPKKIRSETEVEDLMSFNSLSFRFDINYYDEIPNNDPVITPASKLSLTMKEE